MKKEQPRKKEDTPSKDTEGKLKSFSSKETETIWTLRDADAYEGKALELLDLLNNTQSMHHLRTMTLPGTQLEKLKGDRKGQVSLRVIGPYRLCFNWTPGVGATNIEIVDYHR
ncbi:MAG: hypothetical protein BGO67_10965 [Alphaproteobacteria bacterium 41-28]|nr:MAG: hypothetical protein BGO67_10965 [Alphaproteobacteria bacterium 41-28]